MKETTHIVCNTKVDCVPVTGPANNAAVVEEPTLIATKTVNGTVKNVLTVAVHLKKVTNNGS